MSKKRLTSYTFDASAKTITAAMFSDVTLAGIQLIVNVTDQVIIYNFADPTKGGTLATDTLTLEYDTTTMADTDELMILCEDGVNNLQSIQDAVESIDLDVAGILAAVDGIEALLTTIDADTGAISTAVDGIEALLTSIESDTTAIQTSVQLLDDAIVADDTAVTLGTQKGMIFEGVAVNMDGTDPTAVSAEGDAAALRTDPNRILLVNETHPRFFHVSADYASAQTNTSVKAAPGSGLAIFITDIQISNGATAGNITLLDGSGGTVLYELYPGVNGGAVLRLRSPIRLTANTALCITSTTVTTHSVFISGYIAPA